MNAALRTSCLPGTRTRLLTEIIDWATRNDQENGGKNVLWLHGLAGSGKSTIATTVAEYFDALGRQGAYLFFERATSNPASVLCTLAYRLARLNGGIASEISKAIAEDQSIADKPLKVQFNKLLHVPLASAAKTLTGPIIIVLDALDECGIQGSRMTLLKVLGTELATLPHIFRFLITSRAEEDIRSQFESSNLVMSLESMVEEDEALSDIRRYVQSQMLEIRNIRKISEGWPREDEMTKLVQYSDGLFIWAATVSKFLQAVANPKAQLITILSSGKVQGLDSLYATALESSCQWTDDESWADFRSIMSIVLFSRKHLNEHAIDRLLGRMEENSCRLILSRLGCLLDVSFGQPVRPLHASFRDYLTDASRSKGKQWSLASVDPERLLTECCLRVMSSQLHFNMFCIKTSYKDDFDYFAVNTKAEISPELSYACQNWWEHLKSVQVFRKPDPLVKELSNFGWKQFLFWLEVVTVIRTSGRNEACQIVAELMKVGSFIV